MLKKLIKYILAGFSNTFFSYLIYCIFVFLLNYKISYLISVIASIIYTYQVNTNLVFKVKRNSRVRYLFFIVYLIQIIVGIFLIDLWINKFHFSKFLAPILNIIFISPVVFLLSNLLSKK